MERFERWNEITLSKSFIIESFIRGESERIGKNETVTSWCTDTAKTSGVIPSRTEGWQIFIRGANRRINY